MPSMPCKSCKERPVIKLSNSPVSLCKLCFFRYFEKKFSKTVRKFDLVDKDDHIGVAVSGGKDSTTLLHLLNKFVNKKRGVRLTALAIDEGIKGYRDKSLDTVKKVCEEEGIPLHILSYKEEFGKDLDEVVKHFPHPCSICGVFRRYLLNKGARDLKFTKLATGHNLDDEAQSVLMNQFRRNIKVSARLGPITGTVKSSSFIPRIKPLYLLTEKEVAAYAFLKGFMDEFNECPHGKVAYRNHVRSLISDFELKFPGTKHNLILSFLETLPMLRQNQDYKESLKFCEKCGEPCSQKVCQACNYVESVIKKI